MIKNRTELSLKLTKELIDIYGAEKGAKDGGVVIPAILDDFSKMLQKAADGAELNEEYRTEDRLVRLILHTVKSGSLSLVDGRAEKL